MSFAAKVKTELSQKIPDKQHCRIAEIAAIMSLAGQVCAKGDDQFEIYVMTDSRQLASAFFYLIRRSFSVACEIRMQTAPEGHVNWLLAIREPEAVLNILHELKFDQIDEEWEEIDDEEEEGLLIDKSLIKKDCCKRSFLRGVFLSAGSVSNPETSKSYHLEYVCLDLKMAELVQEILSDYHVQAKIVERRKYQVVYLKDGDDICQVINLMDAPVSRVDFELARITKEFRAKVNREVNCVTANISKTVNAADSQIADIMYLDERIGLSNLTEGLEKMARVRLEYPGATLVELGEYMDPPVGKSGVNHRLRRLCEMAKKLREEEEVNNRE